MNLHSIVSRERASKDRDLLAIARSQRRSWPMTDETDDCDEAFFAQRTGAFLGSLSALGAQSVIFSLLSALV